METSKKWFWILLNVFIIVLIIVGLFGLLPELSSWGSSAAPARTVTVSAQGKTTATPDLAELSFSVVTQGKTPSALSDANNTKMNAVLQFVSSQGVATSDITTTGYDLEPVYGSEVLPPTPAPLIGNGAGGSAAISMPNYPILSQVVTGYTLTQTVEVKIHDLTKVADIIGGLAPLGVNQIGGVSFTFNDPTSVTAVARADALNKANTEATQMAQAVGASLGEAVTVSESSYFPMPFQAYGASSGAAMPMAASVTPTINPGTQDITDTVTVTYALK